MATPQRDNSGSLGVNDRKETDKQPDYKGKAIIGGVAYWISGWKKQGERGPWLSLAFQRQDDAAKVGVGNQPKVRPEDNIPF